jgi:hypothetical protein
MKRLLWIFAALLFGYAGKVKAQTASFNFSKAAQHVSGWVNVFGSPNSAVCTGTSSGITVSSVATTNWLPYNGTSFDGGGAANGIFFPDSVMLNHWYQYGSSYNAAAPQLLLSGLNQDTVYTIRMTGSFSQSIGFFELNPIRYTIVGATTYPSIDVNGDYNTSGGAVFYNVVPDVSGNVKVYINSAGSANTASICGIQIITGRTNALSSFWSTSGNIATADTSFLGTIDTNRLAFRTNNIERMTISKSGNITIGGKDTASHPALRIYSNGDLVAGTTMDRSVNTDTQIGMRYYSKRGMLQVGASDRLDTSLVGSGIIINNDESNTLKGGMSNTLFIGDINVMDTLSFIWNCLIASEASHFANGVNVSKSIIGGYGTNISANVIQSFITGNANQITKPVDISSINGFVNTTMDTTTGSLISGALNQFGGASQLVSGQYLVNRTPLGTTLGNANVDFATLPYTGQRQINVPNLAQYPLLALGNGGNASGTVRSNALTVLFNGRTQINTTGFTNQLTQANVTPGAALDVVSTNTGVLLPRLTNAQRNAIIAGDLHNGLLLYNTDSSLFQYYNGSVWNSVGSGSGSGARWLFSTSTNGTVYDSVDNIAIGTSDAKGYKLAVNGSAIFNTVKVKPTGSWPDYVFRKGYQLPGLGELEQYIQKYRHLPGVVAAREAEKNGVDVGENQAALLKKVEELTLYLIDENKQLKAQNAKLAEQDKKTEDLQHQIDELKALLLKK